MPGCTVSIGKRSSRYYSREFVGGLFMADESI